MNKTSSYFLPLSKGTRKFAFILFQLAAMALLALVLGFFITVLWATAQGTSYEEEVRVGTLQLATHSLLALSALIYFCLPDKPKTMEKPSSKDCSCEHPTPSQRGNYIHN